MKYKLKRQLPWAEVGTVWEEVYPIAVRSFQYKQMKWFNGSEIICEEFPLATFSDWFEEVDERWKPEDLEIYFYVNAEGRTSKWSCTCGATDDNLYKFGNCFKTRNEAERAAEQIKALLKEFHKNNP